MLNLYFLFKKINEIVRRNNLIIQQSVTEVINNFRNSIFETFDEFIIRLE
jgi:hypothetical protein